ncbi:MAG: DMT family transporter [Alphaproteobacteria bacterium]|nr:DMT family transporter [Alphaproteobacteria bacterium]
MPPNLNGVLLAMAATAMFSVAAALTKLASADYNVLQILFIRQIIMLVAILPILTRNVPHNLKTRHAGLHAIRLTGAFIALSCGFWAVAVLPLTTATVLAFSSVFFTTLLAAVFLGERVGAPRIAAIAVGFAGVLIVVRPSVSGMADLYALIAIAAALGAATAKTTIRRLSKSESTATLLAYQAIFIGVLAGLPMAWLWATPDWNGAVLLISIGLVSTLAQWVGVMALRAGEASLVTSIDYMQLIYAAILGYWLFSEWPDLYTFAGAALIVGSALFTVRREARRRHDRRASGPQRPQQG